MVQMPIARALISVTDKTGVVEFARTLSKEFGVEIISTGGTAALLTSAGVEVVPIERYTGFPEMMGGRVKTLHPKVHGGLLARRDNATHMAEACTQGIEMIDLVCVNLYEFEKTVADPKVSYTEAIEHIDIGGPSMLRSAAKNADFVTVVSDPQEYDAILEGMRTHGGATTLETRRRLQYEAYRRTAAYDGAIAAWLGARAAQDGDARTDVLPVTINLELSKQHELRYGENPQQTAAFYRMDRASERSLARAQQLQGKELSYNNLLDTDAAWNLVQEFDEPACIILKHQNPCGSATAATITEAYDRAFACDPKSAFGGIIACNREVTLELCQHIADENKQFVEVIIAPGYSADARERLARRTNLRVLATGGTSTSSGLEYRSIDGGMLVQTADRVEENPNQFRVPTRRKPMQAEMDDLMFAWRVCKGMKSNAILIARDHAGIGMGPGQPNRVDSALLACTRAEQACDRVGVERGRFACASDAFFPFRDTVDLLAEHGVTCIIQPGGSKCDDESIAAADEHGIAMVFTATRHFRH